MNSARANATVALCCAGATTAVAWASAQGQAPPPNVASAGRCRVDGRVTSGAAPLPGVALQVYSGSALRAATSTDLDGRYTILFAPNAGYMLAAELPAFTRVEREVTLGAPPCDLTVNLQLSLRPRTDQATPSSAAASGSPPTASPTGGPVPSGAVGGSGGERAVGDQAGGGRGAGGRGSTDRGRGGRGTQPVAGEVGARFQPLTVDANSNAAATFESTPADAPADIARLLPPGFSLESAQADAIAISGNNNATNLDRGALSDRAQAIRLGQIDPEQFAAGLGAALGGPPFGDAGDGGRGGFAGRGGAGGFPGGGPGAGGPGGPGGPGGRGGPGGLPDFVLAGRGARGQSPYQGSATYTLGGSALDSPPYQLRPDVPVSQPQFTKNKFGATIGGPLKIPGLYADTNRRTNFQINYTGNQSNNVYDQYATVPTDAMRTGDFSASPMALVDPKTGQTFVNNQIPASRIDPGSAFLLQFIPAPNLPGTTQNYHVSTTARTTSDNLSVRLTQNLSPTITQGRGGRGAGGFGGGFGGGPGGPGGPFPGGPNGRGRGTNIMLTAQLQYRRTQNETPNVFPELGGVTATTNVAVPISLNIARGRSISNINVNLTHAKTDASNTFTGSENIGALAGINYPSAASADPINWGVPNLLFSGYTGVRGASATLRTDDRLTASYAWIHPANRHQLRIGGDYRRDTSDSTVNSDARGTFTFTGLYASGGASVAGRTGADFADFLLGAPQQATLQVGSTSHLRQHSLNGYIEDNWQKNAKLTLNLGLRYEFATPYVELNGRAANLDATPTFTAVAPVLPGGTGPYTGTFPDGLLNRDANNLGPRLGVAYRLAKDTILRTGYSITYNSGSYASIARELVGQPPAAETETIIGSPTGPLTLAEALLSSPSSVTTNNWGVDKDYALGTIHTWNAAVTRTFMKNWTAMAGYTGTKGTNLDILRAPNRGPSGLLIAGVQPFTWESSGGHSMLHAGTFQVQRRLADGIRGGVTYTLARSRDNASSLGAGAKVVAQNDKDLESEWALSSFDRRHQVSGEFYYELPWGPNRRWLKDGGVLAGLFGEWSATLDLTVQSGTPLTARVLGATADVARGTNGSLRGNYTGEPIALSNPTVDEFFNVAAFAIPAAGAYGNSARNMIIGPGASQLNAMFQRDVRAGGNRALTLQVNAVNLLNGVQWASVDTNVNSPTFGQVLSVRPMRTVTVNLRLRF